MTRRRDTVRLGFDGSITVRAELLPGATVEQRFAGLRDSVPHHDALAKEAWVRCDGCAATARVDFDNPRLPDGWTTSDKGELCPACQHVP